MDLQEGHWTITDVHYVHNVVRMNEDWKPLDYFGFVYRITRIDTGRSYIGKKQLIFTRRKKIKGRVNRKHVKKESDWKVYTGSCEELNQEIKTLGKERFRFEILKFCKTKSELGYTERSTNSKKMY